MLSEEMMMIQEGIETKSSSNQTGIANIVLGIVDELSILNKDILKHSISHRIENNKLAIYVAGDKVRYNISQKGYIWITIKDIRVQGGSRQLLLRELYNSSIKLGTTIKLGSVTLEEIEYNNNIYYVGWDSNMTIIKYICNEIAGVESIAKFEKSRLRKENYGTRIRQVHLVDENEIYSSQEPELFEERSEELADLLQIVYELKVRNKSAEELELLREISSEISSMI